MKRISKFIFSLAIVLTFGATAFAMTQEEADTYNNLYYPQSVYNGGINESPQSNEQQTYVDPATGSVNMYVTDISLPGAGGMDLDISRIYNSSNSSLFEAYLKETDISYQKAYYQIVGSKRVYKHYTNNSWNSTPYNNICLSPKFFEYIGTKTAVWMVQNSNQYEYAYDENNEPPKSKLFSTLSDAEDAIDYLDSINPEIDATFPYDNITDWEVNYYNFVIVTVYKTEYYTDYSDGLLADTATERYSKLGPGWEFDFPYVETRYGYDDNYEYLHFGQKGTWLIDFGTDGGENHLAGYPLNDIVLSSNTSVVHDGERSKYVATQKDGTKYYFGNDGRLLIKEDRFGNRIEFFCDTETYQNVWGRWIEYPYLKRITDTLGRNVVFTFNKSGSDYSIFMTITDPNDAGNPRVYEYVMDKLSNSEVGILGYDECDDIENDEWVLYNVINPEGQMIKYRYDYLTTKFSFLNRNNTFYLENHSYRDLSHGNTYVDQYNFDDFSGIHNRYALLKSAKKDGYKEYYFKYSPFVKNCTPSGSMMFYKVYESNEETIYGSEEERIIVNRRKYQYDINNVGEYDGYITYSRDERINASYNYEVKVADESVQNGKTSYDLYKYTYLGANGDKTILLTRHTDIGTDHKIITDYTYDSVVKLPTATNAKNYSITNPTDYIEYSVAYTYDTDKYGDLITQTPNNVSDRTTTYAYNSIYHYPVSKTYKKDINTTVTEEYIPTNDNKSIEYINIYENNVLKSKVRYAHDAYGNIINEKRYIDSDDYIETEYVYQNGAYVTSQTTKNVADNDGILRNITRTASYDYWGNVISETDSNLNTTSYTYDSLNRLLSITNPDNSTKEYTYYTWNTREKDELGKYIRTYYTKSRDVERIYYQSLGVDHNFIYYDAYGNVEAEIIYGEETDSDYNQVVTSKTKYVYDTAGRPISKEVYDSNNTLTYKETYAYEITPTYQKQITSVIGGDNNPTITKSEYVDNFGNVFKTETATDFETYEFDYLGNTVSVKSANANASNWTEKHLAQYNYAGNIISETDELGNTTVNEYDMLGRKTKAYDANGYASEFVYDELGRVIEQRIPFEEDNETVYYSVKKMWYDGNGNVIKEQVKSNSSDSTDTYNVTEYYYDSKNNLVMSKAFDGENYNYVQNYYDAKGNLLRVYTGLSAPLTIIGLDDVTAGDDEDYAVTKYSYDALGRLIQTTDALNRNETNIYDAANGLLISSTDRNGQTFNYEYNAVGGLTKKSLSDDTNAEITVFGLTGQPVSKQNGTTTISYQYNNKGQLISESDSAIGTVKTYTYDSNGNRTGFILTRNNTQEINQSYTYDKLNRLTEVKENGVVVATYAYDSNGNRTQTVSNGITTTYAYNLANILTGRTDNKLSESYTYYLNGNQKTKTSNNTTTVYEYDSMNRLVRENDTEYSFDDFGNRATMENDDVTVTYEYDKNNRLIRSAEVTGNITKTTKYFFDYNGNQITKAVTTNIPYEDLNNADYTISQATDENIAIYEYDCYNRLVSIETNGAKSVYTYAPNGLRESKTVSGVTTNLVYDNANVVEEIAGNSVNKYIRGLEIIKNGNNVYYLYNGQGDVALLVDNAGTTLANYAFDAYGNQTEENTVYNPFGYRGEYTDGKSGLIYLRARMYDPEIGRFINEDPANDGLNWYVYCGNNPILFIDPTGNESYVFYTSGKKSDFSKQANWQKSYLERGGETVIMKTINSVDEFTKAWDSIGLDLNGNAVAVNKVIIYTHSNDRTLILLDGSSTKALSIDGKNSAGKEIGDLSKLSYKNINELQLLSCNAGHLDPYFAGNSNVASVMSKRISGVTYAYDGNVAFGNPSWKLWGEDIGLSSRLSTTQNSFNQITAYYGKSGRKPKGKLTYYNGEYKPYGYWYDTTLTNGG